MLRARTHSRTLTAALALSLITSAGCSGSHAGNVWKIEKDVDAMTDVAKATATTTVRGQIADLEVTVVCAASGKMAYQFRTFGKDGEPTDFKQSQVLTSVGRIMGIRLDQQKAYTTWDLTRPYSNQILLMPMESAKLGAANQLTARTPLTIGEETFTIDQSDLAFHDAVAGCTQKSQAAPVSATAPSPPPSAPATAAPVEATDMGTDMGTDMARTAATPQRADCWRPPSGPNVIDDPDRAISFQEVQEIEKVNGRPYQQGDSIYGRAENRCPA